MEQNLLPDGSVEMFRAVSREFDAIYTRYAKSCNLSEAEYWSILMICNGIKTQSEISGLLFMSRQTINSAFKLLVKKGLVRLEPLAHNQRTKQASLTEAGERFAEKYIGRVIAAENQAWQELEEQERSTLTQLTRKYCGLIRTALEQLPTIESSSSEDISSQ